MKSLKGHLKTSEEKYNDLLYNSLFANMLDGFALCQIVIDENGKPVDFIYLKINDAFEHLTGLKKENVIGKKVSEAIPGTIEANPELLDIYGRVAHTCKPDRFELFFKPLSVWFDIAVFCPMKGYFVAIFENITEHKKAEKRHREAEERFRALVESTSDMIWQVDENAVYTYVSPKVKDILGYEPDEVVGKTPFDLICDEEEEKILNSFLEIANKKEPFHGLENWNIHKNGSRILLETSGVPILDENGQLMGYRGIDRDITERKKTEQALTQRTELLEQTQKKLEANAVQLEEYANKMEQLAEQRAKQLQEQERLVAIGETAGMVGHDIRNPLQAIVSELYLAKENMNDMPQSKGKQDTLDSIYFIQEQVDYINKIVADLQDYARITHPSFAMINVKDLINSTFSVISIPANIETKCIIKDNPQLMSDPSYLRRIISNLSTNAIQAMPKGGDLTVEVKIIKDGVQITVADTGEGIPKEVQDKIFKPLFTTKSKGQGFGLAVVKKFVDQLGGIISFESEEGKGTTFIIDLPLEINQKTNTIS